MHMHHVKFLIDVDLQYSVQEPLPPQPLSGMLNKHGNRVRLHFKTAQEELWIGTKGNLQCKQLSAIKRGLSEVNINGLTIIARDIDINKYLPCFHTSLVIMHVAIISLVLILGKGIMFVV